MGMKETVARNAKLRRKNELTAIIDKLHGRTVIYKDAIMKIHAGRYATFDNLVLTLFDPEEGPFSNITVNIEQLPVDEFAVDVNNFPSATWILNYNNIAHPTEKVLRSGYCIYPVWKLNEEVLKEYD